MQDYNTHTTPNADGANAADTICAISTPHGTGGIAVVRVSGPQAATIVARRWQGADITTMRSHTAHLGTVTGSDGQPLDQVVLTLFRAPHSFTGEDVIELSCHGSMWIQRQLVLSLIDAGCRAATGGEFTQRAFGNGRLDLSQAEAVADLIAAQSRAAHRVAINQMRGAFSRLLSQLRGQLLQFVSLIELELDFSEEDVTFADRSRLLHLAQSIQGVIGRLTASYSSGNVIKNGLPVAIVGQTNAGKSTLLNLLLHDDRALVSDIQGTTRDVIEDTVDIGGTLFRFIDTAGIRQAHDAIEKMGIERTFQKLDQAQVVLWVIDGTQPAEQLEEFSRQIMPHTAGKTLIAVANKADLGPSAQVQETLARLLPQGAQQVSISARDGINTDALTQMLTRAAAMPDMADDNAVIVTNARHYEALTRAGAALDRAISGLNQGLSGDLVSQDIRECMHYLGEITGEITTDDVLGEIFSHFCVGK